MILCAMFSVKATAGIWALETTEVPQASYPLNVDPVGFEAILTTYNTYMTAFAESDFHTMADQMDFLSVDGSLLTVHIAQYVNHGAPLTGYPMFVYFIISTGFLIPFTPIGSDTPDLLRNS